MIDATARVGRWPEESGLGRVDETRSRRVVPDSRAQDGAQPHRGSGRVPRGRAIPPEAALLGLSVEGVNQCVHCGLCLASCPTFAELGTEMDSPRGRIFLIKALAEGRIALGASVAGHLELCLDCRACETVCPAGVPYGRLIEAAKAEIERRRPGGVLRRAFRWLNFGLLLTSPWRLRLA